MKTQETVEITARKTEILKKAAASGILKDPQWLDRLDEPAPLWVVLEALVQLMEQVNPPHRPYD